MTYISYLMYSRGEACINLNLTQGNLKILKLNFIG